MPAPHADLHVADLGAPLPFANPEFDDVAPTLVLHYLEDWARPARRTASRAEAGGRLILSVNHPAAYAIVYPEADYESFHAERTQRRCTNTRR